VPGGGRVSIRRLRNGARGRLFLANLKGEALVGSTCKVERGSAGAIWTFYAPNPQQPGNPWPFAAFGDVITPAGSWYSLTVSTPAAADRSRVARIVTEALLRPGP
jgi:hypothetical protein